MLNVDGASPSQVLFERSPETPKDLLQGNPDLIANNCVLHDSVAAPADCIRAMARRVILAHNEKKATRVALDSHPRLHRVFQASDMVAVWRKMKGAITSLQSSYRWRPGICVGPVTSWHFRLQLCDDPLGRL